MEREEERDTTEAETGRDTLLFSLSPIQEMLFIDGEPIMCAIGTPNNIAQTPCSFHQPAGPHPLLGGILRLRFL